MKRWQQRLSLFLVVCVVFASAVGINPALHVFIEHGGQGAAHSHLGARGAAVHSHEPGHSHSYPRGLALDHAVASPGTERLLIEPGKPLKLFGLQPQDVYRALGRLVARAFAHEPPAPARDDTGHTHHSLPQMLISGVVEGSIAVLPLVCAPERFILSPSPPAARVMAGKFYLSTAGRAPPLCC